MVMYANNKSTKNISYRAIHPVAIVTENYIDKYILSLYYYITITVGILPLYDSDSKCHSKIIQ